MGRMFSEHRRRLLELMGPGAAVFPAAPELVRNQDVDHPYRQDSDLYYLTGFEEPESVLVLTTGHPEHRSVLFLRERHPERETWDGPRLGVERAADELGVDAAFSIAELDEKLPDYIANVPRLHYRIGRDRSFDDRLWRALDLVRKRQRVGITAPLEIVDPAKTLHEMRLRKSPAELERMRRALEITAEAHRAAMRSARPGLYEYEVEAEMLRVFRANGSPRVAYEPILGSGPNATILHYRHNGRRMEDGDLLLIDAGCEYGHYASDVTRTFPVNGRFSREQAAVYDAVLAAQKAAIARTAPGVSIDDVHQAALEVLVDAMLDMKLLEGSRDEVLEQGKYKRFYMHRTSHWLGMDVHDVGAYFQEGKPRPLEPGFVLTIEPGIYIAPHAECDPRWHGIGIRIEDDVLVTDAGQEVLSAAIPKERGELERILADG